MTTPCDQPILKLKKSVFALDHSRALVVEIEGVLDIVEERMSRFRPHLLEPYRRSRFRKRESGVGDSRVELVEQLIGLTRPLRDIGKELSKYPFDSDIELAVLQRSHVVGILQRYLTGTLSEKDVEDWAESVEIRDDIGFEDSEVVSDAIFFLANCYLNGPLTPPVAQDWIGRLSK